MNRALPIDVSDLAQAQIRVADEWWRENRPKASNAIAEELDRASVLISLQPQIGARATNLSLPGVRRLHLARIRYYLYYRVTNEPDRVEVLAFWHASRGIGPTL